MIESSSRRFVLTEGGGWKQEAMVCVLFISSSQNVSTKMVFMSLKFFFSSELVDQQKKQVLMVGRGWCNSSQAMYSNSIWLVINLFYLVSCSYLICTLNSIICTLNSMYVKTVFVVDQHM